MYIYLNVFLFHKGVKQMKKNKDILELIEEDLDNNIYSHKSRERLVEDDEMTAEEAGFMEGYENAG